MTTTYKVWLHGLATAFIGGASSALAAVVIDAGSFNFGGGRGIRHFGEIAIIGGIVPVLALLKKSPLPDVSATATTTTTTTVEIEGNSALETPKP